MPRHIDFLMRCAFGGARKQCGPTGGIFADDLVRFPCGFLGKTENPDKAIGIRDFGSNGSSLESRPDSRAGLFGAHRPFRGAETNHLSCQPFGQVPFFGDGELEIFESGAGLLHLARKSETLMPRDPIGEAETVQWTIAALNAIEMVTVPWWFLEICGAKDKRPRRLDGETLGIARKSSERAGMAGRRSLHRRGSADGGCAARPEIALSR